MEEQAQKYYESKKYLFTNYGDAFECGWKAAIEDIKNRLKFDKQLALKEYMDYLKSESEGDEYPFDREEYDQCFAFGAGWQHEQILIKLNSLAES
ncbi:MAG: hypothetical protein V4493_08660 [Pseudomonadota bacterium]